LSTLAFHLSPPLEIALVGDPEAADTQALLEAVFGPYRPFQVVALAHPDDEHAGQLIPLLADRPQREGQATAYVCQGFVCQAPVTDPTSLTQQLSAALPRSRESKLPTG